MHPLGKVTEMGNRSKLGSSTSAMHVRTDPVLVRVCLLIRCDPTAKLTPAETLVELKIEWVGDRSVRLMVRDVTMTFST